MHSNIGKKLRSRSPLSKIASAPAFRSGCQPHRNANHSVMSTAAKFSASYCIGRRSETAPGFSLGQGLRASCSLRGSPASTQGEESTGTQGEKDKSGSSVGDCCWCDGAREVYEQSLEGLQVKDVPTGNCAAIEADQRVGHGRSESQI